jgi:glycosyltransferase involved in cell wall biosynthesis
MSVHNGSTFLNQALQSILDQTFADFEFIIVDDYSTDSSLQIIQEFAQKDPRIKIVHNQKNVGLTKSLNRAIQTAGGKYLARIDADDVSCKDRLEKQVGFLDSNTCYALVGTGAYIIDEGGKVIREAKYPTTSRELKESLIKYNPFFHSSIMIRRQALDEVGLYNEYFRFAQDYELYFRLARKYELANLPNLLICYRETRHSITSVKNRQQILCVIKARLNAIRNKQYSSFNYIYVVRSVLFLLLPRVFKRGLKKFLLYLG